MNHAKVGLGVAAGCAAYARKTGTGRVGPTPGVKAAAQAPRTGWSSPSLLWDSMRQIQVSAAALDGDVAANVRREPFRAAWIAWFQNWGVFFRRYESEWSLGRLTALADTDGLAAQVAAYRAQLVSWYEGYGRESDGGKPVPPASGQPPLAPPKPEPGPDAPSEGLTIPWWMWVLGGVALVGGGYYIYRVVTTAKNEVEAKRRALETYVLPGLIGPDMARVAAARDAIPLPSGSMYAPYGSMVGYMPRFESVPAAPIR